MTVTINLHPEVERGLLARAAQAANLMELFKPMRGMLTDEEIDTLFSRNPSIDRPADLA